MTPKGKHLREDFAASPPAGQRSLPSLSDGYQHGRRLWEKRPRRQRRFQPDRLPGHGEAAERRHGRAHRGDQPQTVRLLLPERERERPVPGRGAGRPQVPAEVGLRRAAVRPAQIRLPDQPAVLPGATRVRALLLPLAGRVLLLLPRAALQHLRPVVRTRGERRLFLNYQFCWSFTHQL